MSQLQAGCETAPPVRQGSVAGEIGFLHDANNTASCLIDSLQSRLSDILGEGNPNKSECEPDNPCPNSNLAAQLREQSNMLKNSCDRLQDLLNRVEL
jgi:hypothetical protein